MFEKEAEEYAKIHSRQYLHNDGSGLTTSQEEVKEAVLYGYQKGLKTKITPEEKELIVNTPIDENCFDLTDFCELDEIDCVSKSFSPIYDLHCIAESCDHIRKLYKITKDERLFAELVRLLPNSYKVVNLCAEKRIAELEQTLTELKRFIRDLIYENSNLCFQFSNKTCLFNSDYIKRAEELIGEKL